MDKITQFNDEFHFLSNFYPCRVMYDGELYPSAEHAYVAAKTLDLEQRKQIRVIPAHQAAIAKRRGKNLTLRQDWKKVRIQLMTEIVRDKFTRNPHLGENLCITEGLYIEEGNWHGDNFWGVSPPRATHGKSQNNLGIILMLIREELLNEQ